MKRNIKEVNQLWLSRKEEEMLLFFEDHITMKGALMLNTIHKVFPMFNKRDIVYILWREYPADLEYLVE